MTEKAAVPAGMKIAGKGAKAAAGTAEAKPKKPSRADIAAWCQANGPWQYDRSEKGEFIAINGGKGKTAMIFKNAKGEEIKCGMTWAVGVLAYKPAPKPKAVAAVVADKKGVPNAPTAGKQV